MALIPPGSLAVGPTLRGSEMPLGEGCLTCSGTHGCAVCTARPGRKVWGHRRWVQDKLERRQEVRPTHHHPLPSVARGTEREVPSRVIEEGLPAAPSFVFGEGHKPHKQCLFGTKGSGKRRGWAKPRGLSYHRSGPLGPVASVSPVNRSLDSYRGGVVVPVSPCRQLLVEAWGLSNLPPFLGGLESPLPLSGPQTPRQTWPLATTHTTAPQAALHSLQLEA